LVGIAGMEMAGVGTTGMEMAGVGIISTEMAGMAIIGAILITKTTITTPITQVEEVLPIPIP
jgi:hypothetical protein